MGVKQHPNISQPAGWPFPEYSGSLESLLASPDSGCSICSGRQSAASGRKDRLRPTEALKGLIAFLPGQQQVSLDSRAHLELNDGAFNHPCMIVSVSGCGHLVFCLQATSFGNGTIQHKYRGCRNTLEVDRVFNDFVAIRRQDTVAHNQLGFLDHSGPEMPKQSYMRLDAGFWIETHNLARFEPRTPRTLGPGSLATIRRLYASAEFQRQAGGLNTSALKLATSTWKKGGKITPQVGQLVVAGSNHMQPPAISKAWNLGWVAPQQSPEVATFVVPPKRNAAIAIKAPPSPVLQPVVLTWSQVAAAA